jgi:FkbM family methyltransferase
VNAKLEGKKLVFFGAGGNGIKTLTKLMYRHKTLISYICDNDITKEGSFIDNIPIYSPNKLLAEKKDETVIIICSGYVMAIAKQLFNMGFSDVYAYNVENASRKLVSADLTNESITGGGISTKERYRVLSGLDTNMIRELFADDLSKTTYSKLIEAYKQQIVDFSHIVSNEAIYFNDIFKGSISENEVYLSGGVFNVSSVVDFILYTNNKYKKIYAFEPDAYAYHVLKKELSDIKDLELLPYGISDIDGRLSFDATALGTSRIINDDSDAVGTLTGIEVTTIDNFTKQNLPPTLIKMDIEGAEYDALVGARETLMKYKPKLAISAYHLDDDLVRLPLLIHETVPEYKLYLRHHANTWMETVIYAKV